MAAAQGFFVSEMASKSVEIAKFPVNFPVSRELQVETGSYLTAHTTISARPNLGFLDQPKAAVPAEISAGFVSRFGLCDLSGQAPGFDLPDELQGRLSKTSAGAIEPEGGRQAVAAPQHLCMRAMGSGVAQQLL
jgi:hypothetical protein